MKDDYGVFHNVSIFLITVILCFFNYRFHIGIPIVGVILLVLYAVFFKLLKIPVNTKTTKILFYIGIGLIFSQIISSLFFMMFNGLPDAPVGTDPSSLTPAMRLKPLGNRLSLIVTLALSVYYGVRNEEAIFSDSISSFFLESITSTKDDSLGNSIRRDSRDVFLCNRLSKETNKKGVEVETIGEPIYVPYKDRFLHFLVLGPTGSGKTSQILKPMAWQDIQNEEIGVIVLEPKGDFAIDAFGMAEYVGRDSLLFDPLNPACPKINPLYGNEDDVLETMATTFAMLGGTESSTFFQNAGDELVRNSVKLLKGIEFHTSFNRPPTLMDMKTLIFNTNKDGEKWRNAYKTMIAADSRDRKIDEADMRERSSVVEYFDEYFQGMDPGVRNAPKKYEHTSAIRTIVGKLNSNPILRRILNPENGVPQIDFDRALRDGECIFLSTEEGKLRSELSRYLGMFLILQIQSSIFSRSGTEDTRRGNFFYIDEFQTFANPQFSAVLEKGRSYRVGCIMASQGRGVIAQGAGKLAKSFTASVDACARNLVIFPGLNDEDNSYYSKQFGDESVEIERKSQSVKRGFFDLRTDVNYSESTMNSEEVRPRFSASDIRHNKFTEVICQTMFKETLQIAELCKISFLPMEVHKSVSKITEEYVIWRDNIDYGVNLATAGANAEAIDPTLNPNDDKIRKNFKEEVGASAPGLNDFEREFEGLSKREIENENLLDEDEAEHGEPIIEHYSRRFEEEEDPSIYEEETHSHSDDLYVVERTIEDQNQILNDEW